MGVGHLIPLYYSLDNGNDIIVCHQCNGTGKQEAPAIDALCHAIEVLAGAVEASGNPCATCQSGYDCETCKRIEVYTAAIDTIRDGLQPTKTDKEIGE
jgi:hypothetical protein